MKFRDIASKYKVGLRHNPKHFYTNSFRIELDGSRLVIVAVPKKHLRKRFRIVGFIKAPHGNNSD